MDHCLSRQSFYLFGKLGSVSGRAIFDEKLHSTRPLVYLVGLLDF